jgi:hypothetical protein
MTDFKDDIFALTLGIRYKRSFRIPDISGEIIDDILYSDKTPFGVDYFPTVQGISDREKTLYNPNTSEYLRVNTDDLIVGLVVGGDFEDKFVWLQTEVLDYLKYLFLKYGIKNIFRLGIVFSHKIKENKKLDEAISLLTGNAIVNAENIVISFTQKAPADEGLFRKGVRDYKNRIYNFREVKGTVNADLDYQYYYEPASEHLSDCFTKEILADAKSFLEKYYYNWLNKNYESSEV